MEHEGRYHFLGVPFPLKGRSFRQGSACATSSEISTLSGASPNVDRLKMTDMAIYFPSVKDDFLRREFGRVTREAKMLYFPLFPQRVFVDCGRRRRCFRSIRSVCGWPGVY